MIILFLICWSLLIIASIVVIVFSRYEEKEKKKIELSDIFVNEYGFLVNTNGGHVQIQGMDL